MLHGFSSAMQCARDAQRLRQVSSAAASQAPLKVTDFLLVQVRLNAGFKFVRGQDWVATVVGHQQFILI